VLVLIKRGYNRFTKAGKIDIKMISHLAIEIKVKKEVTILRIKNI